MSSPTTINIANADKFDGGGGAGFKISVSMNSTTDYIINITEALNDLRVELYGGRNVVIEGGEIIRNGATTTLVERAYGLVIYRNTTSAPSPLGGTVDLSALRIHGTGLGQAVVVDSTQDTILQIQKCRFESLHPVSDFIHSDSIQFYRGPKTFRLGHATLRSPGTGLQLQPSNLEVNPVGDWEFRHVSVEQVAVTGSLGGYALWKADGGGSKWTTANEDLWVKKLAANNLAWANTDNVSMTRWDSPGTDGWVNSGTDWTVGSLPPSEFAPVAEVGVGKKFS